MITAIKFSLPLVILVSLSGCDSDRMSQFSDQVRDLFSQAFQESKGTQEKHAQENLSQDKNAQGKSTPKVVNESQKVAVSKPAAASSAPKKEQQALPQQTLPKQTLPRHTLPQQATAAGDADESQTSSDTKEDGGLLNKLARQVMEKLDSDEVLAVEQPEESQNSSEQDLSHIELNLSLPEIDWQDDPASLVMPGSSLQAFSQPSSEDPKVGFSGSLIWDETAEPITTQDLIKTIDGAQVELRIPLR